MKNRIVSNVLLRMDEHLTPDNMEILRTALCIALMGVVVTPENKKVPDELVALDDNVNTRPYMMFFVSKKIEGLSEKTLVYYRMEINAFLQFCIKPLQSVTTDDLRYFLATRGNISNVTLDNKRRILNSFFSWLHCEEYITKNPMARLKVIRQEKRVKKPFSEHEIECLRDACDNIRETAILDLLLSTGMRVGELHLLNRSSVDFARGELTVFGKGAKERVCYLNPKASKHLADYLASRTDKDDALIVPANNGGNRRLGITGLEKVVRDIGVRAGVKDVHPHRFRRTAATIAINRGMPVEQVQQMLGHEQIATTMRYAIVALENVKVAHAKYLS